MRQAHLITFLTVARLQSFRRSSEILNTTQSNVSTRIAALEQELGTKLFHRSGAIVRLTAAGRELAPYAEKAVQSLKDLEAAVGRAPVERGALRLSLSETLVSLVLPAFLDQFARRFPEATVEITVDSTANQRQQLLERDVDVALLMGPVSDYRVSNAPLLQLPLVWTAHPTHPLAAERRIDAEDLRAHPIIGYARNSRPYAELRGALRAAGVDRPRLFASNALSATLAMTREVKGVAALPALFAAPHLAAGELTVLPCDVALSPLDFTAASLTDGRSALTTAAVEIACAIARSLPVEG